ncbi:MAG: phosphatase PAP2 family protein [Acetobacteraceae bacterium]
MEKATAYYTPFPRMRHYKAAMIRFRKSIIPSSIAPALRVPLVLAVIWTADLAWAAWAGIAVLQLGMLAGTVLILLGNVWLYRRITGGERAFELALGITVFFSLGLGFTLLSYLVLTLHLPLADRWLAAVDEALGFDWPAWNRFVHNHTLFHTLLVAAYRSLGVQMLITLFALPLSGMVRRNREFLTATGISLLLTVTIAALLPAESAWVWYKSGEPVAPGPLADFLAMRRGGAVAVDLRDLRGIVTFPSFHVVMAVLLAWASRGTRFSLLSLVINGLMIVATPTEGGHYLIDGIAGLAIAAVSIAGAQRLLGPAPTGRVASAYGDTAMRG